MSHRRDAALLLVLLIASLATGCFRSRTEATQVDAVARFMFTGNTSHAVVSLNQNGKAVWDDQTVSEGKRYEIKPGTYEVIVSRDGELVVHRTLFVDQGKTVEVRIP